MFAPSIRKLFDRPPMPLMFSCTPRVLDDVPDFSVKLMMPGCSVARLM